MNPQILDAWKAADEVTTTTLAATLATLSLVASSFLLNWIPFKAKEIVDASTDVAKQTRKNHQYRSAKTATKWFLAAFLCFAALLVESVLLDPQASTDGLWPYLLPVDVLSSGAFLGFGVIFLMIAACFLYGSVDTTD